MLLFKDDWAGYSDDNVHMETSNKSFISMYFKLKRMGISNNMFHLFIRDKELRRFNPHNLIDGSLEIQARIAAECKLNPWYFFREVLRIPAEGSNPIPMNWNRSTSAMLWCWLNNVSYISIQSRQTGKFQPLDSLIKTPTGCIRMGDIKVGDIVSTPDGGQAPVVGVYPQGFQDIYKITFEDGRSTESGDDHLWKVYNRKWTPEDTRWRVVQLKDIRQRLSTYPDTEAGLFIPLIKPETTDDVNLPLDPYVIGVLLGDGCLTQNSSIGLTTPDQFILNEVGRLLPNDIEIIHRSRYDYRLIGKTRNQNNDSTTFYNIFKSLEMRGRYSYTKTVPPEYMNASAAQRLALIQGMMDTDGTVDKTGSASYCTTSLQMAKQFQYLIRSLGGVCKLKIRQTYYTHNNEKCAGRRSYILRVRINDPKSLFRLPRKRDRLSDNYKSKDKLKLGIKSVEYVGIKEAQCIEVDHPDHLYITDDFIVTHNTTGALSISAYTMFFRGENLTIGMMTKETRLLQQNVVRIKIMRDALPKYMYYPTTSDTDNKEGLHYSELNTTYKTFVAKSSYEGADGLGRGMTLPFVHIDEFGHNKNIHITFSVLLSSTIAAKNTAAANGQPHSNLYTMTAARTDTEEGSYAHKYVLDAVPFSEKMYDFKNEEEFKKFVAVNSTNGCVNGTFSYLQLGMTHEWFARVTTEVNATQDEIDRDYLNIWKSGIDTGIIETVYLNIMKKGECEPIFMDISEEDYAISWYINEYERDDISFKNRQLIFGMDSSDNIGKDFTALVLIDAADMSVVATFRCNESNLIKLAIFIANILIKYPNILFVPERKSSAIVIIDQILLMFKQRGVSPLRRIYNKIVQERNTEEMHDIALDDPTIVDSKNRRFIGFMTTEATRVILYKQVLKKAVKLNASRMKDKTLISEFATLSVINGRIDHSSGHHDDMVIAYLLACYVIFYGKYLEYYGIDPSKMLSSIIDETGEAIDPGYKKYQLELRQRAKHIQALIDNTPSIMLKKSYQHRLEIIKAELDDRYNENPISTAKMKSDIREYGDIYTPMNKQTSPKQINQTELLNHMKFLM
jgi:LAGLIDADG-like domain